MSLRAQEYMCPEHGRWDDLVERASASEPHPCPACGAPSEAAISAPLYKPQRGAVTQGKVNDKPFPHAMDTQPLADGMPLAEWKRRRAEIWEAKDKKDWGL